MTRLCNNAGLYTLTVQEKKVALYIAHGYDNHEIAERMGISDRTVVHYMTQCLNKLDIPLRGASRVRLARRVWESEDDL